MNSKTIVCWDSEHNSSEIHGKLHPSAGWLKGDGDNCYVVPTRVLEDTRFTLRARAAAAWIWGQSSVYLHTVGSIQRGLGVTMGVWETLSGELALHGFLSQKQSQHATSKIPVHTLVFDFRVFKTSVRKMPSSRARKSGNLLPREHGNIFPLAREEKSSVSPVLKPTSLKTTTEQGGGFDVQHEKDRGQSIGEALGFQLDEAVRVNRAAVGAPQDQLDILIKIFKTRLAKPNHGVNEPVGFAIGLAKKARLSALQVQAVSPEPVDPAVNLITLQARLADLKGRKFIGPTGNSYTVTPEGNAIHNLEGHTLTMMQAVNFIANVDRGHFDCE